MAPRGRPNSYNAIMAEAICDEIATGRSVLQITQDQAYPSERTIYRWLEHSDEFRQKYARAREFQAEHYASEIVALADTPVEARKIVIKADGSEEITIGDAVERTKVQIDARKWYASKLAPKKYGDRLEQFISGPDGAPIQHAIQIEFVKAKPE